MAVTRTALQSPAVPSLAALALASLAYASVSGTAPTARGFSTGDSSTVRPKLNENAARLDLALKFGGGLPCIAQGLAVTSTAGTLVASVAAGQAVCFGLVELSVATAAPLSASSWNYLWLLQGGTISVIANSTAAPLADEAVFLGAVQTDAVGTTLVDTSGVLYGRGGLRFRQTADTGVPGDAPPADAAFLTQTTNGLWLWTGAAYLPVDVPTGHITAAKIAPGGVENAALADDSVNARTIALAPVAGYLIGWSAGGELVAIAPSGASGFSGAYGDLTGVPAAFAPSAHKTSHATGGTDAMLPADIGAAAAVHTHTVDDITDLLDSIAPTAHAASHATGGSDAITPAAIGAAAAVHAHDDLYPTLAAYTAALAAKSATGHTHHGTYLRDRGAWSAATAYSTNDVVTRTGGLTYVALQDSTNQDPATATTYWRPLSPKRRWACNLMQGYTPTATGIDTAGMQEAPYGPENTSLTWVAKRVFFYRTGPVAGADSAQIRKSTVGDAAFGAGTTLLTAAASLSGAAAYRQILSSGGDFVATTVASGDYVAADVTAVNGTGWILKIEFEEV